MSTNSAFSPTGAPTAETGVVSPSPTVSGTASYTGPPGSFPDCNPCGNGTSVITNPNVTLTFPAFPPFTCSELYSAGLAGRINSAFCPEIQSADVGVSNQCGCSGPETSGPTVTPTTSLTHFPTTAPSAATPSVANPTKPSSPPAQSNSTNKSTTSAGSRPFQSFLSLSFSFVVCVICLAWAL